MKNIRLKICGIIPGKTDPEIGQLADYLGFIFYDQSPRYADSETHEKIRALKGIKKVGVFVNEDFNRILELVEKTELAIVQLHGEESPEFCKRLNEYVKVIKVIPVRAMEDLIKIEEYRDCVDYFLFDTKGVARGGNGIKFNWDLLKDKRFGHPFFLSGGISREDAAILRDYKHPDLLGIDINSCFEIEPGKKDMKEVSEFKNELYD